MSGHTKVYGICENKCMVEIAPKTEVEAIIDTVIQQVKTKTITVQYNGSVSALVPEGFTLDDLKSINGNLRTKEDLIFTRAEVSTIYNNVGTFAVQTFNIEDDKIKNKTVMISIGSNKSIGDVTLRNGEIGYTQIILCFEKRLTVEDVQS